jgi:putative oxidoreductase
LPGLGSCLAASVIASGWEDTHVLGFMDRLAPQIWALFRIVTGLLFLWHGASKLFGFPQPAPEAPAFILYVAGPIELFGGILVMIGLFTRPAAFLCSGLMASAYWMAHGTNGLFPMLNGGEKAVLYCFAFLCISAQGAGIWSVDGARSSDA